MKTKNRPMYRIYLQDSFCFADCVPDGNGPDDNGDTYTTRAEAIVAARHYLQAIFDADSTVRALFEDCDKSLAARGAVDCSLPYRDEETGEVRSDGDRLISISVAEYDACSGCDNGLDDREQWSANDWDGLKYCSKDCADRAAEFDAEENTRIESEVK